MIIVKVETTFLMGKLPNDSVREYRSLKTGMATGQNPAISGAATRLLQMRGIFRTEPAPSNVTTRSANIQLCLFLIYYFSLCDTALKLAPAQVAIVLRYLPEALLYFFALLLLFKRTRVLSFPLFWPLFVCGLTMTISGILNSSSILGVIGDFRIFFRFAAFTYIGWRTTVTPTRIAQFIKGFLGLAIIEMVVGGIELIGGPRAQDFFYPVGGWNSGAPAALQPILPGTGGSIAGTLSNYNNFGFMMTISCALALTLYSIEGSRRHLWLASAFVIAVVLSFSRHSLLLLAITLGIFFLFQIRKIWTSSRSRRAAVVFACVCALVAVGGSFSSALRTRVATAFSPQTLAGDPVANMRLFMALTLAPRFLSAYPFFGQGPIPASETVQFGEQDTSKGPTLKAAPDLPGWLTFYFTDVVWVMILGLYGCFGLAAFGYVLWTIGAAANKVRKNASNPHELALAHACIIAVAVFVASGFFSEEMIARDCIPVFWLLAGLTLSSATKPTPGIHVSSSS